MKFLVLMAVWVGLVANAQAQSDTDWKKGKWERLAPYIGTYEYDEVLKDAEVHESLLSLLSEKEYAHLLDNMLVRGPIGFEGDCLVLTGNKPHQGNAETAIVNLCIYAGKAHVAIFSKPNITLYTSLQEYHHIPQNLRGWIARMDSDDLWVKQPRIVIWEQRGE